MSGMSLGHPVDPLVGSTAASLHGWRDHCPQLGRLLQGVCAPDEASSTNELADVRHDLSQLVTHVSTGADMLLS